MFRRRRMMQAMPLTAPQLEQMVQANQLLAQGKKLEAGAIFAGVADELKDSNHPRRAANVYTRAAHAYADGNDASNALACSRQALSLFIQNKMARRAAMFYTNITRKMSAHGMKEAEVALRGEFADKVAGQTFEPRQAPHPHGTLPTDCPKCGAPVHGDDVNWVDEHTVECEYCGALIRVD